MATYTWVGNKIPGDFTSRIVLDGGAELLIGESADIGDADLAQLNDRYYFLAGTVPVDTAQFPFILAKRGAYGAEPSIAEMIMDYFAVNGIVARQGSTEITNIVRNASGLMTNYTENGIAWTIGRDANGHMTSITKDD